MLKRLFRWYLLKLGNTCHRLEDRSFHTKNHQSILCFRCSSVYGGVLFTAIFLLAYGFYNAEISIFLSVILMFPVIIDGITQRFTKRNSSNIIRIITGFLLGSSFALLIGKSIQSNFNLLIQKVAILPDLIFIIYLSVFIILFYIIMKRTSPKSIYVVDAITIIGSIILYLGFFIAVAKILVNMI